MIGRDVSFITKLAESSRARDSIVCVGLDPRTRSHPRDARHRPAGRAAFPPAGDPRHVRLRMRVQTESRLLRALRERGLRRPGADAPGDPERHPGRARREARRCPEHVRRVRGCALRLASTRTPSPSRRISAWTASSRSAATAATRWCLRARAIPGRGICRTSSSTGVRSTSASSSAASRLSQRTGAASSSARRIRRRRGAFASSRPIACSSCPASAARAGISPPRIRAGLDARGGGVLPSASRSVTYASSGADFEKAAAAAAARRCAMPRTPLAPRAVERR